MNLPVRLRLTLWYSLLLGSALALFSLAVYLLMSSTLLHNLDGSLRARAGQIESSLDVTNGRIQGVSGLEQADAPVIPSALVNGSGAVIVGTPPRTVQTWLRHHTLPFSSQFKVSTVGDIRLGTAPIVHKGKTLGYVLVWESVKPVNDALRSLLIVMLATGPALLLIAALGGLALGRRALSPVTGITRIASRISATDLRRRVPVSATRDELSELALTFNAMIDRLEAAVQRERQFTADASHELRSPLAVVRAETTLALERSRQPEEYARALQVVDEQTAAMEDLISALLLLARVEGLRELHLEDVTVDELVSSAVKQCMPSVAAAAVRVERDIPPDLIVQAAPALLVRAIRNVVENAIKASPPGGNVLVGAALSGDDVVLHIEDTGPGIPPEEQERIFDPFYQVSTARTPGDSHGLGLAICRRVVRMHGGDAHVTSRPGGGTIFSLILPQQPPAPVSANGRA